MDAVAVEQTVPADEGTTTEGIGEPINTPGNRRGQAAADTDGLLEAAPASEAPFQAEYQHAQEMEAGSDLTTAQAREDTAIDAQAVPVMDPEAAVGTSHDDAPPVEPAPTKKRATRSRRRRSTAPHSGNETSNESAAEGDQGESVGVSDTATSPDAAADGVIEAAEAAAGAGGAKKKSTRSRRGGTRRNTPRAAQETPPQETPPTDGGS
jgi:hypothetical protein